MVKSLLLYNVKSQVFNFRYQVKGSNREDHLLSDHRIEQRIPLVSRDSLYKFSIPISAYALSMEAIKTLRFFLLENNTTSKSYVVNIVNCSRYPRMLLRKLSRNPIILHFYMANIRLKPITRLLAEKANFIVASSYTTARHLREIGVETNKIMVLYPPIDTEFYKPLNKEWARSRLGLSSKAKIILYIGGLKRVRFPTNIIMEAMRRIVNEFSNAKLLVFTSSDMKNVGQVPEIIRKAKSVKLTENVSIHARDLTDLEKNILYNAADVFLFPSHAAKIAIEPPLTVLEAMASGATVVVPKVSPLNEIVDDTRNGFSFLLNDYDVLADKLANALSEAKARVRISTNARQTIVDKASPLVAGGKLVRLYSDVLHTVSV